MRQPGQNELSRRERQIMDILYEQGSATAVQVRQALVDPPSNSAVRTLLRVLEEKGHVRHVREGQAYVFHPVVKRALAKRSAVEHILKTFFNGSIEDAVATLIDVQRDEITDQQFERLSEAIERARKEGK